MACRLFVSHKTRTIAKPWYPICTILSCPILLQLDMLASVVLFFFLAIPGGAGLTYNDNDADQYVIS